MILVDTAIWVDHLHHHDPVLAQSLAQNDVVCHSMIIGELALGSLARREHFLSLLMQLPTAREASNSEILEFISIRKLRGRGLGLVDAHLLAAALLTPGTVLRTRDKRLRAAAETLEVAWSEAATA